MNSELRTAIRAIVRSTMNKATLAYVVACNYTQTDIDRVANVKEGECRVITKITNENGIEYRITINCTSHTTHIPLLRTNFAECSPTKSTYLIALDKALSGVFNPQEIDPFYIALALAKELDASVGYVGMLKRLVEDALHESDESEVVAFIESALTDYIKEVLS